MAEKIALVTGATDGIGKLTAVKLAELGYNVVAHGRNEGKATDVANEIIDKGGKAEKIVADLSSLDEVKKLAAEFHNRRGRLDILINNAGLGSGIKERQTSRDGHEMIFAVNYLAPFYLTHLLWPALEKAGSARIVNVSSAAQTELNFDDLMLENNYDGSIAYGRSKLALTMFTFELAARHGGKKITANALHPGSLLNTKMVREAYGKSWGEPDTGAEAVVYLAAAPELNDISGKYFDQKKESQAHRQAYDAGARKRLWDVSRTLTGMQ